MFCLETDISRDNYYHFICQSLEDDIYFIFELSTTKCRWDLSKDIEILNIVRCLSRLYEVGSKFISQVFRIIRISWTSLTLMWWIVRIIKISSSNSPPLWTVLEKNKFWHYFYNLTIASERPWLCDIVTCGGHVWNLEVPSPRGPEIDWSEMQKYFKSHGSFIVSDIKYFSGIKIFCHNPSPSPSKSESKVQVKSPSWVQV